MATATISESISIQNARSIPKLTHVEAGQLAAKEFERILGVVASLSGDDWSQPTDCTEWTVREMVAHLAGSCAAGARPSEFFRQMVFNPYMREMVPVDALNRRQVEDRAGKAPAELVDELREMGPKAIRNRQRTPWLLRQMRFPFGEPLGFAPLAYLLDTIYPRDEWMHRVDLCRATGRRMELTVDHDARMVALVLRDLAQRRRRLPDPATIDLSLTGDVGLDFRFGDGEQANAAISMDLVAFCRLTSGRLSPEAAAGVAVITGDAAAAHQFLETSNVPY